MNIFYYFGILYIIDCIRHCFKKQDVVKELNESINTAGISIDSAMNRDFESANNGLENIVRNILSKNKLKILIGFLMMGWELSGVIISDQNFLFGLLFVMTMILPHILIRTLDANKLKIFIIDNIIHILIAILILYNHFINK